MSHSRSKGHRQQHTRHPEPSQEWNQGSSSSYREQDRYGQGSYSGQGGYGGSQGVYGNQGGYRSINYADRFGNPSGESEFQGSREYRESPSFGRQQDWRSDWRSHESGWRPEEERMPQYREGPPERGYPQWGNDTEVDDTNRRSNVTRFGNRREAGEGQSSSQPVSTRPMPGRQSFAGRGPQGYKRSDERINEDINEELTQDPELDASDVSVEVKNGEVILKGSVPDRESKRRAEDLAECCSGVKDVMNQLRIKSDDKRSDDKRNKVAS